MLLDTRRDKLRALVKQTRPSRRVPHYHYPLSYIPSTRLSSTSMVSNARTLNKRPAKFTRNAFRHIHALDKGPSMVLFVFDGHPQGLQGNGFDHVLASDVFIVGPVI